MVPGGRTIRVWAGLTALILAGCFTEIGNPGKEQAVTAQFRIDYTAESGPVPIGAPTSGNAAPPSGFRWGIASGASDVPAFDSVRILQFYMNVVEINYDTSDNAQTVIWKVPDSLGKSVDFTAKDKQAVLPPLAVPPAIYTILKLECRIPSHVPFTGDTVDFAAFSNRAYIKGVRYAEGKATRFLIRTTNDYKINLVYHRELLEQWRYGNAYDFDFVFYATRWISGVDLDSAVKMPGRDGIEVALIDMDHNPDLFAASRSMFFKSFNSSRVWKENPSSAAP